MFFETRDNSLIRIVFVDDGVQSTAFEGRISDEGTYEDESNKTIRFTVLSLESGFRKVIAKNPKVFGETLTAKNAVTTFLGNTEIIPAMTIGEIKLGVDFEIDNPDWFSGKTLADGLSSLMIATSSIMSINNMTISVFPRQKVRRSNVPVFYGYNDRLRRTPMIFNLRAVNTGVQRVFNSITVNEYESRDINSINKYGFKELEKLEVPFIFDRDAAEAIGTTIVNTFSQEKEELEVMILSKDSQGLNLGDIISIDSPSRKDSVSIGKMLALYGMRHRPVIPLESGRIIPRVINWEIYEKNENTKQLNCMLKLRRV